MARMTFGVAAVIAIALTGCNDPAPPIDAAVGTDATVDAPADAGIDADLRCQACTADQLCVQRFNGTCGDLGVECQTRNPSCDPTVCDQDCVFWQCNAGIDGGIFSCMSNCPQDIPGAFHCYGP